MATKVAGELAVSSELQPLRKTDAFDPGLRPLRDRLTNDARGWRITGAAPAALRARLPEDTPWDPVSVPAGDGDVVAFCPFDACSLPEVPAALARLLTAPGPGGRLILILPAAESALAEGASTFWAWLGADGAATAAEAALAAGEAVQDPVMGLIGDAAAPQKNWLAEEAEDLIRQQAGAVTMERFRYVLPAAGRAPEVAAATCERWHWGWDIRLPEAGPAWLSPDTLAHAVRVVVDDGGPLPPALAEAGDKDWGARAMEAAAALRPVTAAGLDFCRVFVSGGHVQHVVSLAADPAGIERQFATGSDADPAKALCLALYEMLERVLAARWRPAAPERPYVAHGARRLPLAEWHEIAPDRAATLEAEALAVTEVRCLSSGAPRLAPAVKVGLYPNPAASPELRGSTSVGLALGTSDDAAVLAGALEVIERHAFRVLWDGDAVARPITLDLPGAAAIAEACEQDFADVAWYEIGGALPVPVILCRVTNRPRSRRPHRFSLGLAAGFDADIALKKALKEAIQTDFGRGDIVNAAPAQGWPEPSLWTPEARILFWAGPEAPDFPARSGDPVALSRLAAEDVADAAAARQRLTAWAEDAGVAFYSRILDRVTAGDQKLTVARVISPELRALPRVEPREAGVVPHPFF